MGQFKCHHVAATLLYGYKRASKTDIKCSWLKHPKSAPPKCTTTMQELYPHRQPGYRALKCEVSDEDRSYMYNQLGKLGRFTALHWILAKEPEVEEMPVPVIEDILLSQEYVDAECKQSFLRKKLLLTPEKILATAFLTVGQKENGVWAIVRKLRLTASNFRPIIGAIRRNRLTPSLKKRLLSVYNLEKRAPIQWGLTHEETAVHKYCTVASVSVVKTGIWLHESGILGASPDGFVQGHPRNIQVHPQVHGQLDTSQDIIEVKCPFSAKSMKLSEACVKLKDYFLQKDKDGAFHLKNSHDYHHQIQGQLYLTGTQCCDLVVWTTLDIQVIRILKDPAWQTYISSMIDFYYTVFLPSLQ